MIDFILHVDTHLDALLSNYGPLTYIILFVIIFCETGLVVTPFLPGDSLLFAAGVLASRGSLNPHLMALLLIIAAIIGDGVNYMVGHFIGARILRSSNRFILFLNRLLSIPANVKRTELFYEKYGGKAVVFARFVPIIRTFAPFLAGLGSMQYPKFLLYNVVGGVIWVLLFVYAGYFFGEHPVVKHNFTLVIFAIIFISILPPIIEFVRARRENSARARL